MIPDEVMELLGQMSDVAEDAGVNVKPLWVWIQAQPTQHEPDALRELIANEAHAVWADWYMLHGVGEIDCGDMARTHYIDLPETDKEKYRTIADRYLALIGGTA